MGCVGSLGCWSRKTQGFDRFIRGLSVLREESVGRESLEDGGAMTDIVQTTFNRANLAQLAAAAGENIAAVIAASGHPTADDPASLPGSRAG